MCLTISSNIKQEPFIIHKTDKFLTSFAVCICWIGRLNREVIFVVPCVEAFAQRTYISCTYAYIWIHLWIWTLRAFSRPQCKQRKACVYLLNSINLPSLVCVCVWQYGDNGQMRAVATQRSPSLPNCTNMQIEQRPMITWMKNMHAALANLWRDKELYDHGQRSSVHLNILCIRRVS